MEQEIIQADIIDEVDEGGPPRKRLGTGTIIVIVVVLIILAGIGFFIFYDPSVRTVEVINPDHIDADGDGTLDSVEMNIIATSVGPWRVNDVGKLEVRKGSFLLYSEDVKIKNDRSRITVAFEEFVEDNGIYTFTFSIDGESSSNTYNVGHVPSSVNFTVQEEYVKETDTWRHVARVVPVFTNGFPTDFSKFNGMYDLTLVTVGPEDYTDTKTYNMRVLNPEGSFVTIPLTSSYQGFHDFDLTFENRLVKSGSLFRTITPASRSAFLNRAPVFEKITYPSTIRRNEEVTFTIVGSDPDVNGAPEAVAIFWDTDNPDNDDYSEIDMTGSTVTIDHTFAESREYNVTFTLLDNAPVNIGDPPENYKKYQETFRIIRVERSIFG